MLRPGKTDIDRVPDMVVNRQEIGGMGTDLEAAAVSCVAATVTTLTQLLYFLIGPGLLSGLND